MLLVRFALIGFLAAAACGSTSGGPKGVLDQYSAALRAKDYPRAYSLMSSKFREQHSEADFLRMLHDNPQEVGETAARLSAEHRHMQVTAEFRYGLGENMKLVQENGVWRVESNPIQFYSQSTPREAVRSFVRAYRLKRWEVLLDFVPKQYRDRMTVAKMREQFEGEAYRAENANMMNILEANLDEPISEKGTEARMPYGDRYEVRFLLEDGAWKIQDLDSAAARQ